MINLTSESNSKQSEGSIVDLKVKLCSLGRFQSFIIHSTQESNHCACIGIRWVSRVELEVGKSLLDYSSSFLLGAIRSDSLLVTTSYLLSRKITGYHTTVYKYNYQKLPGTEPRIQPSVQHSAIPVRQTIGLNTTPMPTKVAVATPILILNGSITQSLVLILNNTVKRNKGFTTQIMTAINYQCLGRNSKTPTQRFHLSFLNKPSLFSHW